MGLFCRCQCCTKCLSSFARHFRSLVTPHVRCCYYFIISNNGGGNTILMVVSVCLCVYVHVTRKMLKVVNDP